MEDLLPVQLVPYSALIMNVAIAILIFIVGWIASKWTSAVLRGILRKKAVDEALTRFLASLGQYAVLAATIIVALGTVGVETTGLVALLATAGLAVGLALQGTLSNFAAGVMILLFRPFSIGDKITGGGHTGSVKDIGLFATILLTPENERIILPNSSVTASSITNFTVEGTLRGTIDVGIAYGSDVTQATEIMIQACNGQSLVLGDPAPSVTFGGFGASSLDFIVRPWSNTNDFIPMLHDVRVALYEALNQAGIEIPFNQIVVHEATDQ